MEGDRQNHRQTEQWKQLLLIEYYTFCHQEETRDSPKRSYRREHPHRRPLHPHRRPLHPHKKRSGGGAGGGAGGGGGKAATAVGGSSH